MFFLLNVSVYVIGKCPFLSERPLARACVCVCRGPGRVGHAKRTSNNVSVYLAHSTAHTSATVLSWIIAGWEGTK